MSASAGSVGHVSPSLVLLLIVLGLGALLVGAVRESWARRQAQRVADREAYRRELARRRAERRLDAEEQTHHRGWPGR